MYNNINAIATAGKTRPVRGTRTDGKKEAAIVKPPVKSDYNSTRAYSKLHHLKAKLYIFVTQSLSTVISYQLSVVRFYIPKIASI